MGTEKRERQKANKAARLAEEAKKEARQKQIRLVRNAVILAVAIIAVGFLLAGCGSSSEGTAPSAEDGSATTGLQPGASSTAVYGTGECPPADGVDEPVIEFDSPFAQCIDPAKTYSATAVTTEGTVEVALDTERTPVTVNNFVALARYGYYDGTDMFRTEAPSGIIQGGAPRTQDNSDPGPGANFFVPDEALPFSSDDYGPGTLAMARTPNPDSASGQYFFLANEGARYLGDPLQGPTAGSYVAFGTVTEGLDVLETIAALDDGSGQPSRQVTVESVTIDEA